VVDTVKKIEKKRRVKRKRHAKVSVNKRGGGGGTITTKTKKNPVIGQGADIRRDM